jgi:murein DD-endopeptidase MepM/ murein hydrolase activator NlpD
MSKPTILFKIVKVFSVIILVLIIGLFLFFNITTSVTENIDDYEYELPFKKGTKHKVIQGYGGLFSHQHIAALDFAMPVGTPIYAARDGIVYSYRDNSDEGGISGKYKNKSNYIMIKHEDGSIGCYWHLQKDGVLIKSGRVSKGQQIGISGATGQVVKPHLHFSVKRVLNYEMNSFVRTKFKTTEGVVLLKNRQAYERPAD